MKRTCYRCGRPLKFLTDNKAICLRCVIPQYFCNCGIRLEVCSDGMESICGDCRSAKYGRIDVEPEFRWDWNIPAPSIAPKSFPHGFVFVPAGKFMMGASDEEQYAYSDERPLHEVTLTNSLLVQKTVVTVADWERVYPPEVPAVDGKYPKTDVTWLEALKYCNDLSKIEGLEPALLISPTPDENGLPIVGPMRHNTGYRLLTEAEWEYCCKAGASTSPPLEDVAWFEKNSDEVVHPVGEKQPNAWGFYDMLGNVREMVMDRTTLDYSPQPIVDPLFVTHLSTIVTRGGYYLADKFCCRATYRSYGEVSSASSDKGFRICRNAT